MPADRVGWRFDADFLASLPAHVDPCGENGEFHTFVEWAPGWKESVSVEPSRLLERFGFSFVDLRPIGESVAVSIPDDATNRRPAGPLKESVDPFKYYERLGRVRNYVDEHLHQDLTVGAVAVVAAMRPSSFGRYFRSRVGVGFRQWLAYRCVRRARELLRKQDATVERIGAEVGFRSVRTFRHVFREYYGSSPSQYRKSFLSKGDSISD